MKIYNFFPLEDLMLDVDMFSIKEGDIINGKILDISADIIVLEIENIGKIKGKSELEVSYSKGEKVNFLVKSFSNEKLELTPISNPSNLKSSKINIEKFENKKTIDKIFKEYNIVQDEISEKFVKNLFKYNAPINKNNIMKGIKTLDKLEEILNKGNEEKIILFNDTDVPVREEIKNFVLVNKEEYNELENFNFIYDNIEEVLSQGKITNECIKAIAFFIKNDIKISVNNLKKLFLILEGKEIITEDSLELLYQQEFEEKQENTTREYNLSINDNDKIFSDKKAFIFTKKFAEKNDVSIKNYYKEMNEKIEKINDEIKANNFKLDKNAEKSIKELDNSLDFLNEINKEMTFLYIPIRTINQRDEGAVSIFKKRKRNSNIDDNFNIFINLDMTYLKRVKIYFNAVRDVINIKLNIEEDNISLFKRYENMLYDIFKESGYELNSITYVKDKDINLLDTLVDNHSPYYYLDVRV